ncbi:MAG: alpha-ketoacid dehydrogenase subunit alpha/beta [Spirochaetota bacterium]
MPEYQIIDIESKLTRFRISNADINEVNKLDHLKMLELVYLIRTFENNLLELKEKGLVHGPVHSSVGQEAVAAGCGIGLQKQDIVGSTHRAHHHFLAKALPRYYPDDYHPSGSDFSGSMQQCVEKTLSEIMGLRYGWCGGRGGSMHLRNMEAGIIGTNAIVGGGIALTTGAGWALNLRQTGAVSVAFLGDGAVNQGILLESANLAGSFHLPVIYFIENNLYAVGTRAAEACALQYLAQRALGLGMDGIVVDGMDPASVFLLIKNITDDREKHGGPVFVEALTYRFYHHAGKKPGSSLKYRTGEEEEQWAHRDPARCYPETLKELGILDETENRYIQEKINQVMEKAVSRVVSEKEGVFYIPDRHWPPPESVSQGVPGSGQQEFRGVQFYEREDFSEFAQQTFVNVMSRVAARNMERDPWVIVLGEEVANLGGGVYNATRFPLKQFPERVVNTPISEAGFTGMAFGACLCGIKPVVEIMFPDFALVGADQLFNQIAKLKYLYGGDVDVPLVVRTRIATGLGYGAQHSSDLVGLFAMFRGWRIIAPSSPFDYVGLFNTAMLCRDPVMVFEHHSLYRTKGEVPRDNLDYCIQFGKARKFRKGEDLTVVTYLRGVSILENIADELRSTGISIEGIDLRTLDYHSIDYGCIINSVKKTGRLAVVEESPKTQGIGARIADEVQARGFAYLEKPVFHIGSVDVPIPVSKKLEQAVVISDSRVKEEIVRFMNR